MTKNKKNWILYCRSFLLTLGGFFILFSLWGGWVTFNRNELYQVPNIALIVGFLIIGVSTTYIGLYSPNNKIEKWANASSKHWFSIVLMLLAYPVYLVLLSRQKRNTNA